MATYLAGPPVRTCVSGLAVLLLVGSLIGCSREAYFRRADREVKALVAEKSNDPRWAVPPDFTVAMDPRSRYFEPYRETRPPMPEDDPASHQFMHRVDHKRGYPSWHKYGERCELENPDWPAYLSEYATLKEDGSVELSLEAAVLVARLNSPDFQDQLETMYLSALDVSTERFRFDVQFFGGTDTTYTHLGRLLPGGANRGGGSSDTLRIDNNLQLERRFATAGELLVGVANSFVWQFAGPDQSSALSILSGSLTQPLLRGAGRAVALEQLTIAERNLLANLRAFQRYRQGFYSRVAIGDTGIGTLQRRGGFFGGTGLTGFTGTGSGGIGGVASGTGFGVSGGGTSGGTSGGGGAGFAGGGAGTLDGFLGLLQRQQQIRNQTVFLHCQQSFLNQLRFLNSVGRIDLLQLNQATQNYVTAEANRLQATATFEESKDRFLTATLGLPPNLPLQLDDSAIRRVRFMDPWTDQLPRSLRKLQDELGDLKPPYPIDALRHFLEELARLRVETDGPIKTVVTDLARAEKSIADQGAEMAEEELRGLVGNLAEKKAGFQELQRRLHIEPELADLRTQLQPDQLPPEKCQSLFNQLVNRARELSLDIDELFRLQIWARVQTVSLPPVEIGEDDAVAIARVHRLDWMNNRAALVDTWRLITYNANFLESNLTATVSGDIATVGDNPVKFRAPTATARVGLQFDAPFTRLQERNSFRQVLIDYQQDRRKLIQFGDSVRLTMRQLLRQLRLLRDNWRMQRTAVNVAYARVDQASNNLRAPPTAEQVKAAQPGQGQQLGPTAARDYFEALNDLQTTQNNVMSIDLSYHAARLRLMRELGIMQLDENGVWIDIPLGDPATWLACPVSSGAVCPLAETPAASEEVPPPVPEAWLLELDAPAAEPAPDAGEPASPPLPAPPPQPDRPRAPESPLREDAVESPAEP